MKTREYKTTQFITNLICIIVAFCAIMPFVLLVVASFTDNAWASSNGFSFFPKEWSLEAYQYIGMKWGTIGRAYFMTIAVTVIGTLACLFISVLFAYGISR